MYIHMHVSIMFSMNTILIGPNGQPPGEMVVNLAILHGKRPRASSYF